MHLTAVIVLPLIVLARIEPREAPPSTRDGESHFKEEPAVMPAPGLRAQDGRPWVLIRCCQQRGEAISVRSTIVVEQPQPFIDFLMINRRRSHIKTGLDGFAETDEGFSARHVHNPIAAESLIEEDATVVG
jgi:hypothetical protein